MARISLFLETRRPPKKLKKSMVFGLFGALYTGIPVVRAEAPGQGSHGAEIGGLPADAGGQEVHRGPIPNP